MSVPTNHPVAIQLEPIRKSTNKQIFDYPDYLMTDNLCDNL